MDPKLPRYAAYLRVSTEDQADRGTIENQNEFAAKYCDLHQILLSATYKDDGVTGTIPLELRPDGQRLLRDAKAGSFDVLLVYKLDRLGRSARIILNAVHELEGYGVKIKSMTEPFDTGDPSGRFMLTILAGVADLERETILERMWLGANKAARSGRWLGGIVPFGYIVDDDGFLAVNHDPLPGSDMSEAGVIKKIYDLLVFQGYTTTKIADYLNALGIPPSYTRDGRQVTRGKRLENTAGIWRPGRVRNMIVNPTYKGEHHYGKRTKKDREIIVRSVPAIIAPELWEAAQQTLRSNQLEAMRNSRRQYLLRGLVKCGTCGLTYIGKAFSGPGRELTPYYVCNGKHAYRGPKLGKCISKNVPGEWLETLVWEHCLEFIRNPGEAIQELAASMEERKSQQSSLETEKASLLEAIAGKESEKQSILDLYRRKLISSLDVEHQLQRINSEKDSLEQRVREIETQLNAETNLTQKCSTAEQLLSALQEKVQGDPPFDVKREVVKALVQEIEVDSLPDSEGRLRADIRIKYNFSPQLFPARMSVRGTMEAIPMCIERSAMVLPREYPNVHKRT